MQTISTKYLPCTNTLGSRVKAATEYDSKTISWDYAKNADENHMAVVKALKDRLGWEQEMVGGHTKTGMVFVFTSKTSPRIK